MRTLWLVVSVVGVVNGAVSVHAQQIQAAPPLSARPAVDSVPMSAAQVARFKALNDRYRSKFQAVVDAAHKTPGDTSVLLQARQLQAEYHAAYQAILTPEQRTRLAQAEATARARAAALPKPKPSLLKKTLQGGTAR